MPFDPILGRRAAAGLLAGLLPLPAWAQSLPQANGQRLPIPDSRRLEFRIMRKGSNIGSHVLVFTTTPGQLVIATAVSIVVKFGPIALFRYTHHVTERWATPADRPATLVSAEAKTDDDGTPHTMRCQATAEGLAVDGSDTAHYVAPAGTLVATHWNGAELRGPMVNPQGGKLLSPTIAPHPPASLLLANGTPTRARRYVLTGDAKLDLWYDMTNIWAGIRFVAKDGSIVLYQRV